MYTPLKDNEGKTVYPSEAALLVDDLGAIYDTAKYESLKNPEPPAATESINEPAAPTSTESVEQTVTPPVEAVAAEQTPSEPATTIDYDAILKEKTGGKVEKWEDLLAKLETPAPAAPEFQDEASKQVYDYLLEGKQEEVFDFLYRQKLLNNVDKLEDTDKIKLKLQLENPEWSEQDVEDEFDARFGLSAPEDELTEMQLEREKRAIERRLKSELKETMKYLEGAKKDLKLPKLSVDAPPAPAASEPSEDFSELEKINQAFTSAIEAQYKNIGSIDLSINDKDVQFNHSFEIPEADRIVLAERAKNFWKDFEAKYSKDGVWDGRKLLTDMYVVDNIPAIIKSSINKAASEKYIGVVKGIANVQGVTPPTPATDAQTQAHKEALERFLFS